MPAQTVLTSRCRVRFLTGARASFHSSSWPRMRVPHSRDAGSSPAWNAHAPAGGSRRSVYEIDLRRFDSFQGCHRSGVRWPPLRKRRQLVNAGPACSRPRIGRRASEACMCRVRLPPRALRVWSTGRTPSSYVGNRGFNSLPRFADALRVADRFHKPKRLGSCPNVSTARRLSSARRGSEPQSTRGP